MRKLIYTFLFLITFSNVYAQGWVMQSSGVTSTLRQVVFSSKNMGWAVGDGGTIIRTTNGGVNWSSIPSGTTENLRSVSYKDSSKIFACGDNGIIIKSTNSGLNWTVLSSGTSVTLRSISSTFSTFWGMYAAGDNGTIVKSTNEGANWTTLNSTTTEQLNALIHFSDGVSGYYVGSGGNNGKMIVSNAGSVWTTETQFPSTTDDILSYTTAFVQTYNILRFATSETGKVYRIRSVIGQQPSWQVFNSGVSTPLRSIAGNILTSSNRVWAVGDNGVIRYSIDTGSTWRSQTSLNTTNDLYSVFMIDSLKGWIVGEGGSVAVTINAGVGINQLSAEVPQSFELKQNYPNPFNPSTRIRFDLAKSNDVKLIVYNSLGKEVSVLLDQHLTSGTYEYEFDAEQLTSGIYFYMLHSGDISEIKKMMLIK